VSDPWAAASDLVCALLEAVYVTSRAAFEREARERGLTLEQLAAAAVTEAVRERTAGALPQSRRGRRDGRTEDG
jgi:hypothetical protein